MNSAPIPVHHVVLIGLMGTGKSTVGRVLAKELDRDFVDTDAAIERDAQKDIAHIFTEDGEELRNSQSFSTKGVLLLFLLVVEFLNL